MSIAVPIKRKHRPLPHLADRIFGKVLMITASKRDEIIAAIERRVIFGEALPPTAWVQDEGQEDADYYVQNGIAIIPVQGTLVKRSSGMDAMSGLTSYEELTDYITDAITDPDVKGLLFDVDSPGGEAAGMFDLADFIYSMRGQKPMYAVSNDSMYSAAYALGCGADRVYVTREGGVGSIGCFMLHVNQAGMDKQRGLQYTYIAAPEEKVEGNPHEALGKDAYSTMKSEITRLRDMFVTLVARNRNVTVQQVMDTKAGLLNAQQAIPLLADQVGGVQQAYSDMMQKLGIPSASEPDEESDDEVPVLPSMGTAAVQRPFDLITLRGPIDANAIPAHKTATSGGAWDGPANEARLKANQAPSYYKRAYAWYDPAADGAKKSAYKFIHHEVSGGGDIGAANIKACQSGIGVLNGGRGGTTIPSRDRGGVYAHLARHLRDAGKEPAPLKSEADVETDASIARLVDGQRVQALLVAMDAERILLDGEYGQPCLSAITQWPNCKAEAPAGARKISMLVVPYGHLSADLGGYKEIYQSGCFRDGLDHDPRAVLNHESNCILGRASAGTAKFWEDAEGVHVECEAPETSWADDLLVSMRRGDITQASAAFYILGHHWETRNGERVRVVERALMREAGPQSFPAYESTQAAAAPLAEATPLPTALEVAIQRDKIDASASMPPVSEDVSVHVQHELDGARLQLLRLR